MNMSVKKNLENCQYHLREGGDLLMEHLTIVIERVRTRSEFYGVKLV